VKPNNVVSENQQWHDQGMTGDVLRTWRRRRHLKQTELAVALGVSERTVQRWEGDTQTIPKWLPIALYGFIRLGEDIRTGQVRDEDLLT
jgi:transcriptional regulator with XRE-family HTH domain